MLRLKLKIQYLVENTRHRIKKTGDIGLSCHLGPPLTCCLVGSVITSFHALLDMLGPACPSVHVPFSFPVPSCPHGAVSDQAEGPAGSVLPMGTVTAARYKTSSQKKLNMKTGGYKAVSNMKQKIL